MTDVTTARASRSMRTRSPAGPRRYGRRFALGSTLLIALWLGATSGCSAPDPAQSKVVLVFVDVSGSVKDADVYRQAWSTIADRLDGGDRILLGRIGTETFTGFKPVVDLVLPVFTMSDNRLQFNARLEEVQTEITAALDLALEAPPARHTDILNTLLLAQKVFEGDPRRKVLVLLSDMIEDSPAYNFDRSEVTPAFTTQVIEERAADGRLPDLDGAAVYVAGASARTAERALAVQDFWFAYITAAGGRLENRHYAPALLSFEE